MREHAIPQDVVGYRFHIVGNMTLKQFLEVGAGCIIGLLLYNTNLYTFIKWPLIGLAVALGAMAAFVPFEERPLDHWITTFFKVLYKPTKFFWKREPHIPDPFLYKPNQATPQIAELDLSPARKKRAREYMHSITLRPPTAEETQETDRINQLLQSFNSISVTTIEEVQLSQKPSLVVKPHSLRQQDIPTTLDISATEIVITPDQEYISAKQALAVSQVAQDITIPENTPVEVAEINNAQATVNTDIAENMGAYSTAAPQKLAGLTTTNSVTQNEKLPFPSKPSEPNKIVGMVLTPSSDIISDAILEIVDKTTGMVVRAVKTNTLGQFFITTPLPNGEYVVTLEHPDFAFQPVALELSGELVEPLEIRSA